MCVVGAKELLCLKKYRDMVALEVEAGRKQFIEIVIVAVAIFLS